MELASHPGCYVWNPAPQPDETATWTGECSAGFCPECRDADLEPSPRLTGTRGEPAIRATARRVCHPVPRRWSRRGAVPIRKAARAMGPPVCDGDVQEGPYEDGEKNDHWVLRFTDGQVQREPYANGERHERWQVASPDGEVTYVEFVHGVRQEP